MMNHPENHAMTEVSLALAMAFFAIFILTAVSMSTPDGSTNNEIAPDIEVQSETPNQFNEGKLKQERVFIIYHMGRYYDQHLSSLNLSRLDRTAHYVLGVMPDLTVKDMVALKRQKKLPEHSITLLNDEWQQRLESL